MTYHYHRLPQSTGEFSLILAMQIPFTSTTRAVFKLVSKAFWDGFGFALLH